MEKFTLETSRLLLRPTRMEDAEAIYLGYASDPEVSRFMIWSTHTDIQQTKTFLRYCEKNWISGRELTWVLELKDGATCLGVISCRVRVPKAEIGYVMNKSYWNRGLMTEALERVSTWAMAQSKVHRVWATCSVKNHASRRVLEKVGMVCEGTLRSWLLLPNLSDSPEDCFVYSKVRR